MNRPGALDRIVMPSGVSRIGGTGLWTPPLSGADENPYKYGWQGATDGLLWANVRVVSNRFHGTIINFAASQYDDSVCLFPGVWGDDLTMTGTIYRGPNATAATSQEVEFLMCGCAGPNWWSMYELMVSVHGSSLYSDIVRWNGPTGQFDPLQHVTNPTAPIIGDGDIFKATKVGPLLTTYYARAASPSTFNQMAQVDISTGPGAPANAYGPARYTRGLVGVGFWQRAGSASNLTEFGLYNVQIQAA